MDYKIISKKEIPLIEPQISKKQILFDLLKSLALDKAICFKCKTHANAKELQQLVYSLHAKLRRENYIQYGIRTEIQEVPLTLKRQEAYENCEHKGIFPRTCYFYVWKGSPNENNKNGGEE